MLQTMVKVSRISNLTDARYAAGMGAEYLGFSIDQSLPDYVEPMQVQAIAYWVAGVKLIGHVKQKSADELNELLQAYETLHGIATSDIETAANAQAKGLEVFFVIENVEINSPTLAMQMSALLNKVHYFVLENMERNKLLTAEEIQTVKALATSYPIVMGFGFDANNVCSLLETAPLSGIELRGSHEQKPGFKDLTELSDILEQLEVLD
jgi:phosphoribosylanthranilate isomerase